MLLEDFNYYLNKAIYQYINKRYNIYDINQQTTDDLRVLKATANLVPEKLMGNTLNDEMLRKYQGLSKLYNATYEVTLPPDYLHMLNCICIYKMAKNYSCYNRDSYVAFAAKRLTADAWSQIINDYYNRPLPQRPYYYIHNVNINETVPTNPETDINGVYNVTDRDGKNAGTVVNLPRTQIISGSEQSLIQKSEANRYGNASKIHMQIRYGYDDTIFQLVSLQVDYIKTPQHIRLTQEQVDRTEDTSQVMEYPDYVCQEIINEFVMLVMEATADPRLNTHIPVTQSIATQQQTPQSSGK